MRMERHTCSPASTSMKWNFLLGCTLKLRAKAKFGINEYCEMLLAGLYRECFPESPHPIRQTVLNVVKRLKEMGSVTSRPRVRRRRNIGL
ncbi:hypothetical protein AVEN_62640-1 [Araneus ventricosus]|uniref:DUF4817 domain-containing protein n=1 Tax=Araneus ventricosus TaxID=182803 RepID=A0A4Y2PD28_ARAVE|nr:hypothetical protein AVEN_62640-1 [Araneus ventricosus]